MPPERPLEAPGSPPLPRKDPPGTLPGGIQEPPQTAQKPRKGFETAALNAQLESSSASLQPVVAACLWFASHMVLHLSNGAHETHHTKPVTRNMSTSKASVFCVFATD